MQCPCAVGGDDVAFEQQRVAEEAGDECGGGVGVQLGAGSALHDAAVVHDGDAVADHQGFTLVVGDVDDRDAELAMDAGELELHGFAEPAVQRGQGFVEQQDAGLIHEGSRQGDALALAAAELADGAMLQFGQLHEVQRGGDPGGGLLASDATHAKREGDVVADAEVGEQCQRLEDDAELTGVRGAAGHAAAADDDVAAVGVEQARDDAQQRGLARAGWSEEREELALADLDGHVVKNDGVAVALADVVHPYRGGHRSSPIARSRRRRPSAMPRHSSP